MSGLSIQLNRLSFGGSEIPVAQFYPAHKKGAEEALTKIFDTHVGKAPSKEFLLRVAFKPAHPTLQMKSQEISLPQSRELKKMDRVIRYYQHTGYLPRPTLHPSEERARKLESKKSIQAINDASLPGANGSILAGMRLADDTLSLSRNIMFAIPTFGPNDAIANHLGYYAGIFWTFFAFREFDDGISEYKRSKKIGDEEGLRRSQARLLSGSLVGVGSLAYLGGKVCDTLALSNVSSALLGASNVLFGAGSLLAMGTSLLGAIRCNRFNKRLDEYINNSALTEQARAKGVIQFLKDSISITPEEKADMAAQIEEKHPEWSRELKEQLLCHKLADLTEVKVKYMKRRTSNRSLRLILEQSDQILSKLNDPNRMQEGIRDTTILINTIRRENKIKMSLYILGFIAALLSFVAMTVAIFMSVGSLFPFMLYGISGVIYLCITIYLIAGTALRKNDQVKFVEAPPLICATKQVLQSPHNSEGIAKLHSGANSRSLRRFGFSQIA